MVHTEYGDSRAIAPLHGDDDGVLISTVPNHTSIELRY